MPSQYDPMPLEQRVFSVGPANSTGEKLTSVLRPQAMAELSELDVGQGAMLGGVRFERKA